MEKTKTIHLLQSITMIQGMPVVTKTIGTSGTIKALIKKHLDNQNLIEKTKTT
jgi:RNase P/RNase MRP subunit POP5